MEKRKITIPGTKLAVNNTQLLVSSGIPSLDDIVGGGLPVGTITLVEEDVCATYSTLMLQYFLAEGVVCDHSAFVGSQELNSASLVSGLPAVITVDEEVVAPPIKCQSMTDEDKLKIAWRYQNVPTSQTKSSKMFGHFYDLTKVMDKSYMDKAEIKCWTYSEKPNPLVHTFSNPAYHELLESIKTTIDQGGFSLTSNKPKKSILRIALHSVGSPLWLPNKYLSITFSSQKRDLDIFIFCLRAIVRSALAVVMLTIPSKIIDEKNVVRCIHSSDIVTRLQSFTGTELENNNALSDYQGFFHVVKLPAINTLVPKELGPVDFAFKLRRKKFTIEELHLPPVRLSEITFEKKSSNGRKITSLIGIASSVLAFILFEFLFS